MKREILCLNCGKRKIGSHPNEGHKKVVGYTLFPMMCDFCGLSLPAKEKAVALSLYMQGGYSAWESEYLDIESCLAEDKIESVLNFPKTNKVD